MLLKSYEWPKEILLNRDIKFLEYYLSSGRNALEKDISIIIFIFLFFVFFLTRVLTFKLSFADLIIKIRVNSINSS